jgi:hypothetical protein
VIQYNYNRKYELTITRSTELFGQDALTVLNTVPTSPSTVLFEASEDYTAVSLNSTIITDLQLEADIEGSNDTSGSDTRKATIKVYNLSSDTRTRICKKNNLVVLKAGYESYEDELPIIFSGQVESFTTEKVGEDIVTTFICKDGYIPVTTTRVDIRVPAGKTYRDVYLALAAEWNKAGVATGKIVTDYQMLLSSPNADLTPNLVGISQTLPPQDIQLLKGWSYRGPLRRAMDELGTQFNHTWEIINNRLYVHPKYYPNMIGVVELDDTQIISAKDAQNGTSTGATTSEPIGIVVETLLDGRIDESKRLRLTSGEKKGEYPIKSVKHTLNYEGANWNTTVECTGGDNA